MKFRFSIKDLMFVVVGAALIAGWSVDHQRLDKAYSDIQSENDRMHASWLRNGTGLSLLERHQIAEERKSIAAKEKQLDELVRQAEEKVAQSPQSVSQPIATQE